MSTLNIRVHKRLLGAEARSGAIADVLPIPDRAGAHAYRGLVIPVGQQGAHTLEVEPGEYLVSAYLPSGGLLSLRTSVAPGETKEALLEAEDSPHEWLSWQSLVGRLPRPSPTQIKSVAPKPVLTFVELTTPHADPWRALQRLVHEKAQPTPADLIQILGGAALDPGPTRNSDEWTTAVQIDAPNHAATHLRYAIVERGPRLDLISLPLPWPRNDGHSQIEIAIPHNFRQHVNVIVTDPQHGPLLGFIAHGQLPLAAELARDGSEAHAAFATALAGKFSNPFAAAAGAYLLFQADHEPDRYWHRWVHNLARAFRWLPDGPALLGALTLRFAKSQADVNAASAAFADSIDSGIPVFAPVLRLLLDGVSTIVEDSTVDAGNVLPDKLRALRSIASAMQTDQAFTCLHFWREAR